MKKTVALVMSALLLFGLTACGNEKQVAESNEQNPSSESTGGELFGLEPKEAYTDSDLDWTDGDSRVCREHENEDDI